MPKKFTHEFFHLGRQSRIQADFSSAPRKSGGFASIPIVEEQSGRGLQDEWFPGSIALMADIIIRHHRIAVMLAAVGAVVMQVPVLFRFGNQGLVSQDHSVSDWQRHSQS